jgi:hypothetical protein
MALGVAMGFWRAGAKHTFRIVIIAPTRELSSAWLRKLAGDETNVPFSDVLRVAGRSRRGMSPDYFQAYVPEFSNGHAQAVIYSLRTHHDAQKARRAESDPELAALLRLPKRVRRIEVLVTSPRFLNPRFGVSKWRKWARQADVVIADEAYGIRNEDTLYGYLARPGVGRKTHIFRRRPWLIALSATMLSKDMRDMRDVVSALIEWRRRSSARSRVEKLRVACANYNRVLNDGLKESKPNRAAYREASTELCRLLRRYMSRVPTLKNRTYERWLTHQRTYRSAAVEPVRTFPFAQPGVDYSAVESSLNVHTLKEDLGRFLRAAVATGSRRLGSSRRSWLRLTEMEGLAKTGSINWPKPAALQTWIDEHIAKIEMGDHDSPRFKIVVYCHHVQTAKMLGRLLSKPIHRRIQQGFRRLVRQDKRLFDGFVSKPKSCLEKALQAKRLRLGFVEEVSRRNPTLLMAGLLNAQAERVTASKLKALLRTLAPTRLVPKQSSVLSVLRRNMGLRARVLEAIGCSRLAHKTVSVPASERQKRAELWHVFNDRRIRDVLTSVELDPDLNTLAHKVGRLDMRTAEATRLAQVIVNALDDAPVAIRLLHQWNEDITRVRKAKERDDLGRSSEHRQSGIVEVLTGENPERRIAVSQDFLSPGNPLVLILTNVCSMGVDLHNQCWDVLHYSPSWTPSDFEQKSGRIDRPRPHALRKLLNLGAARQSNAIRVHHLIWPFTYDERVLRRMNLRGHMAERLLSSRVIREATDKDAAVFENLPPLSLAPAR